MMKSNLALLLALLLLLAITSHVAHALPMEGRGPPQRENWAIDAKKHSSARRKETNTSVNEENVQEAYHHQDPVGIGQQFGLLPQQNPYGHGHGEIVPNVFQPPPPPPPYPPYPPYPPHTYGTYAPNMYPPPPPPPQQNPYPYYAHASDYYYQPPFQLPAQPPPPPPTTHPYGYGTMVPGGYPVTSGPESPGQPVYGSSHSPGSLESTHNQFETGYAVPEVSSQTDVSSNVGGSSIMSSLSNSFSKLVRVDSETRKAQQAARREKMEQEAQKKKEEKELEAKRKKEKEEERTSKKEAKAAGKLAKKKSKESSGGLSSSSYSSHHSPKKESSVVGSIVASALDSLSGLLETDD